MTPTFELLKNGRPDPRSPRNVERALRALGFNAPAPAGGDWRFGRYVMPQLIPFDDPEPEEVFEWFSFHAVNDSRTRRVGDEGPGCRRILVGDVLLEIEREFYFRPGRAFFEDVVGFLLRGNTTERAR